VRSTWNGPSRSLFPSTSARRLDGMPRACYLHAMANLQVKNVPEALHRKLRAYARRSGRTLRDVVLSAVAREMEHLEFQAQLAKRQPVDLGRPAARSLEETRAERDRELGT